MPEPTVEQILKIDEGKTSETHRVPFYVIALSLVIFAPLAFVLMWLDETYHRNFRLWLIIIGATSLLEAVLGLFSVFGLSRSSTFSGSTSFGWSNFLNFL